MKTKIAMLSMLGAAVLVTAGSYESCFGEPCPDLYIACPDLECPEGFKVDKSGCAICECVGEVPPVNECFSDADCPAGEFCAFEMVPMTDAFYAPCEPDASGAEYCGAPRQAGECRPIEVLPCAGLDEWTCIQTRGCQPVYEGTCDRCAAEGCGDVACDVWFIECIEAPVDPCFGAWIDEFGGCRGPADGTLPAECCGQIGCWSDADCPTGMVCAMTYDAGGAPGAEGDALVAPMGWCVAAPVDCFSDFDCQPGYFCAVPPVDCGGPIDSNGDGVVDENDPPVDCIAAGVCVPIEPIDPCASLDEQTCAATTGCLATYIDECTLCADGSLCDPVMPCTQVFAGCVSIPLPTVCFSDEECGAGMVCSFDLTNCGGEQPVDGGAPAPVNCGGTCIRA